MAPPYLKHNNIYFVPILRQRLNFAVLVQRAAHELGLGRQDLIAVALPQSIRDSVEVTIRKLPTVSFITTSLRRSDQREVFPITPADGMIEAIRTAQEWGIPLEFIDQEVIPGHLVDRHCISYQDWPDDGFVLERGIEWYFNLVQERLSHPPARFEPVDTWRERYMAEKLRRFHPLYRNILVVCHAAHVYPIKKYLGDSTLLFAPGEETLPKAKLKISEPSLPILMRYLGDMPKLVELYEAYRQQGRAKDFDKTRVLIETIHQLDTTGFNFSIRHYQAFMQLLSRMLEIEQRTSPELDKVLVACESCFNKPFGKRVFRHLVSYFDQVQVKRIVHVMDTGEELLDIEAKLANLGESYVARTCDLVETTPLQIIDPPRLPRTSIFAKNAFWPPWEDFTDEMVSKAFKLANRKDIKVKTVEFQGSLHNGIDFRRTLRSYLGLTPRIYVKQHRTLIRKRLSNDEPQVWLFDINDDPEAQGNFEPGFYLFKKATQYLMLWNWQDFEREYDFDKGTVFHANIRGMVQFPRLSEDDLAKYPEEELQKKVPSIDNFVYDETFGDIPAEIADLIDATSPWWELLFLAAIKFAKETVLCILPQRFVFPRKLIEQARFEGKRLQRVPLEKYTQEEQRKLRNQFSIDSAYLPKVTRLDEKDFAAEMKKRFGYIMEQYWG